MIQELRACFSTEKSNMGRQPEIDVAKGISVILMIITHTYEQFSGWDSPLGVKILYELFGGPLSAAVFMFCMGMSICYSRNNTPSYFFRRGIRLLILGFVIGALRCILPPFLAFLANEYPSFRQDLPYLCLETVAEVDILQFSGIFFLVFALLNRANITVKQMFLSAILLVTAGLLLRDVTTDRIGLDIILGYFWKNSHSTWFPFFSWYIIPVSGYAFGNFWIHCCNKRSFYRIITPGALLLAMAYFLMSYGYENLKFYYGLGPVEAVFSMLTALAMLGISYSIASRFPRVTKNMRYLSRELTPIYFAHRLLLPNLYVLITVLTGCPDFSISDLWIIPIGIVVLFLSCFLTGLYNRIRNAYQ